MLKYDKGLEQEKELLIFRKNYKEEAIHVDFTTEIRKKRCAKDSFYETTSQPWKQKAARALQPTKKAKEKSSPQRKGKLRRLVCKFDLYQSELKSSQVNANVSKTWLKGLTS